MPDHSGVFAKISRILAPGGYLVVATENPIAWKGMNWPPPPGPGEIRDRASKKKLHHLLTVNGVQRVKSYTWYPDGRTDGIFKLINGRQVKRLLHKVVPEAWTTKVQEAVGLGLFRIVVARRPLGLNQRGRRENPIVWVIALSLNFPVADSAFFPV
jgi:hypothetical protein